MSVKMDPVIETDVENKLRIPEAKGEGAEDPMC